MTKLSVLFALYRLVLLSLQNSGKISVLWGFFSHFPIDSYPHTTQNKQQTNQHNSQASLELAGGVLPAHVVVGSSLDVPLTVRFGAVHGEHIL